MESSEECSVRGISKPVYLQEALGELKKTEEARCELNRTLKLEAELRITIIIEQNPGAAGNPDVAGLMQALHSSENENFVEQVLQIEKA